MATRFIRRGPASKRDHARGAACDQQQHKAAARSVCCIDRCFAAALLILPPRCSLATQISSPRPSQLPHPTAGHTPPARPPPAAPRQAMAATDDQKKAAIAASIRVIPDFPKKGIMFQDVSTLLLDPVAFQYSIDLFVDRYKKMGVECIAGWLWMGPLGWGRGGWWRMSDGSFRAVFKALINVRPSPLPCRLRGARLCVWPAGGPRPQGSLRDAAEAEQAARWVHHQHSILSCRPSDTIQSSLTSSPPPPPPHTHTN